MSLNWPGTFSRIYGTLITCDYTSLDILLLFQGMGCKKEGKIIQFEIGYGVFF